MALIKRAQRKRNAKQTITKTHKTSKKNLKIKPEKKKKTQHYLHSMRIRYVM